MNTSRMPQCSSWELIKVLQKRGFRVTRASKHFRLSNGLVFVSVPHHQQRMSFGLTRGILKQAGISEADYRELLK